MDPHVSFSTPAGPDPPFPTLPIVTPDDSKRSTREKYGALYYLGAAGLIVVVALVAWFAVGVWSLRSLLANVYVLHDAHRPEAERIAAAFALSRDPHVNQRQAWDICLRTQLPDLARYLMAESLTGEAASADPKAYALAVAHSPGWPVWLRLLLTRPMAYAAADGVTLPRDPLEILSRDPDPAIGLWATATLALQGPNDELSRRALNSACENAEPDRDLACLLADAAKENVTADRRKALLNQATLWLRSHHRESAQVWRGWTVSGDTLVRTPTSR
jgi:hypothetical protein